MSNQFPPAGNGQDPQNPNFGGNDAQSNSGYDASTGGYQGYTPQSDYQGYGQGGQQGYGGYGSYGQGGEQQQGQQSYGSYGSDQSQQGQQSYGSYGQGGDQQAQQSYGGYGQGDQQQGQQSYGSYGSDQSQQGQQSYGSYGQGDQQQSYGSYGTDQSQPQSYGGYQAQPGGEYGAPQSGGYASQGGQPQGSKKKIAPWMMIVGAVVALALIGGAIWGGIALFGGGGVKYPLSSDAGVDKVKFSLNKDVAGDYWTESQYNTSDMFMVEDAEVGIKERCQLGGMYTEYTGDISIEDFRNDPAGAIEDFLATQSSGADITYDDLGTIVVKDAKGEGVEFQHGTVTGPDFDGNETTQHMAFHPFVDSGTIMVLVGGCEDGAELPGDFKDEIKSITFDITPMK